MNSIVFRLKPEDVREALMIEGSLKNSRITSYIKGGITLFLMIGCFASAIINPSYTTGWWLGAICAVYAAIVFAAPVLKQREMVRDGTVDAEIHIDIYDEQLMMRVPQSGSEWSINRENFLRCQDGENIRLITVAGGKMVCIPKAAIGENAMASLDKCIEYISQKDNKAEEKQQK